jgi:hypothetical protein
MLAVERISTQAWHWRLRRGGLLASECEAAGSARGQPGQANSGRAEQPPSGNRRSAHGRLGGGRRERLSLIGLLAKVLSHCHSFRFQT